MSPSETSFKTVLEKICSDPLLETEWLDMLSQLEYAGCRKIIKGVPFSSVTLEVLNHVMEEASHAFLLKSLVEKQGVRSRPWTQCPLTELGWNYFQTLDQGVCRLQGETFHYPAVSWIVEQRVLSIYPLYVETTRNLGVRRVLLRILAQEKRHGSQFGHEGFPEAFRKAALEWEAGLWSDFVRGLEEWARDPASRGASKPHRSLTAAMDSRPSLH